MNYLVVGLGNIGAEYASTRHNMGFMVLDAWAQASNLVFESRRYGSVAECSYRGRKLILLKPSTYMNLSGNAVCDDLTLPFGTVRMRMRGSDGGHNGLKDIEDALGTQQYARIRIGIGNDFKQGGQIDFVLGEISEEQKKTVQELSVRIVSGIETFTTAGPERAMNLLNAKSS